MNSREKTVVTIALAGVALGVLFVGYTFVYAPLTEAWERKGKADEELGKADADLNKQAADNERILKENPRLGQWNKLSLPPRDSVKSPGVSPEDQKSRHISKLKSDYESTLRDVMKRSGMKLETVRIEEPKQLSPIGAPPKTAKGVPPLYDRVGFKVTGVGPQEAIYKALKEFHATDVLHDVRNLKVSVAGAKSGSKEKADPNRLQLDMTVEALIVSGAEERSGLRPTTLTTPPRVLAEPARDYEVLSKRSLFTGLAKPEEKRVVVAPKVEEEPEVKVSERERRETLEFVKLTMLAWNANKGRWEATFYDQAQGKGEEIKVDGRLYKSFTIYGEDEKEILAGKVVYIDGEQVVFTADGKHFRARVGDFLDAVYKEPLSAAEKKKLGL